LWVRRAVISLTTKQGSYLLVQATRPRYKTRLQVRPCAGAKWSVAFLSIARPTHANRVENGSFFFNRANLGHGARSSPIRPTGPARTKPRRDTRFCAFITRDDGSKSQGNTNSHAGANRSASTPSERSLYSTHRLRLEMVRQLVHRRQSNEHTCSAGCSSIGQTRDQPGS